MKALLILAVAAIVLIASLIGIAFFILELIARSLAPRNDPPASPRVAGPADAAPSSAAGPKVSSFHGGDND